MQHGYPVSHVNFSPNEFLWMDEDYIIRDENGDVFENSWDVNNTNEWDTGWYIFKNKTKIITTKAIPFRNAEESYITEKQLISHIGGTQCAGKEKCQTHRAGGTTLQRGYGVPLRLRQHRLLARDAHRRA